MTREEIYKHMHAERPGLLWCGFLGKPVYIVTAKFNYSMYNTESSEIKVRWYHNGPNIYEYEVRPEDLRPMMPLYRLLYL